MAQRRDASDLLFFFVQLDATTSVWLRHEVGGLLYLSRVSHDRDGGFRVGPWNLLPGGWEHLETFTWSGYSERSTISAIKLARFDADRALLLFSMGTSTNYAMILRPNADGSFSVGEPVRYLAGTASFPWVPESGTLRDDHLLIHVGEGRVILLYTELVLLTSSSGGSSAATSWRSRLFTGSGLDVAVGPAVVYGDPYSVHDPVSGEPHVWYDPGGGGGWFDQRTVTSVNPYSLRFAWYREVGGNLRGGQFVEIATIPSSATSGLKMRVSYLEPGWFWFTFAKSTGYEFVLVTVVGDVPSVVGRYSSTSLGYTTGTGPTSETQGPWTIPMSRRNVVDQYHTVSGGVVRFEYRDLAPSSGQVSNPHVAAWTYPPSKEAYLATSMGKLIRLDPERAMGLSVIYGEDPAHQFAPLPELFRLVSFYVPPVCPPAPEATEVTGTPLIRVSQGAEVVRTVQSTALSTTYERTPCGQVVGALSNKGPVRVYPVGRR